jgi:hypothetical protein
MSRSFRSWKTISGRVMEIYTGRSRPSGLGVRKVKEGRGSTWRSGARFSDMHELLDSFRSVATTSETSEVLR